MSKIMVFPRLGEFEKAKAKLDELNLEYTMISPPPGYDNIAIPSIVFEQEVYTCLISNSGSEFVYSGCVDYRQSANHLEEKTDDNFTPDIFGRAYIMVLSSCIADETKVRVTAHLSEDVSDLLPYLNTFLHSAFYNDDLPSLTFMEQHRTITIYKNKIAIARADDITDVWRIISKIRTLLNHVNYNKSTIVASCEMRKKPPVLEIYSCLPKINCGKCQQKACMPFAFALHSGTGNPFSCKPIFEGDYKQLQNAFMEICARIGISVPEE